MNILITLFDIQDYGGIVENVECMARGLTERGHTCSLVILRSGDREPYVRRAQVVHQGQYVSFLRNLDGSPMTAHLLSGWYNVPVLSYGSKQRMKEWKKFAGQYDAVIHEIPVPKPSHGWEDLYRIGPPQVVAIHDAHYRDMYPHLELVSRHVTAAACVNHAAFVALEWSSIPRALVPSSHVVLSDKQRRNLPKWTGRPARAVCAHVWKAWKHMDYAVRLAPVMKNKLVMGGDGIEGRYMRSRDKCKPRYQGLWKQFQKSGSKYLGVLPSAELGQMYQDSKLMLDFSFSKKFFQLGSHYNRSVLEALNAGAVPVCDVRNMMDLHGAPVELWRPTDKGESFYPVDIRLPSEAVAAELLTLMTSKKMEERARNIVKNGREIMNQYFSHHKVAQDFEHLLSGEEKDVGVYPGDLARGKPPKGFQGVIKEHVMTQLAKRKDAGDD